MNRNNVLYLAVGVLAIAAVFLGYRYYQERQKTSGIQIEVGKEGVTIETK